MDPETTLPEITAHPFARLQERAADFQNGTLEHRIEDKVLVQMPIQNLALLFPSNPGVRVRRGTHFIKFAAPTVPGVPYGRKAQAFDAVRCGPLHFSLAGAEVQMERAGRIRFRLPEGRGHVILFPAGSPHGLPN